MTKVNAITCPKCKTTIFSRAHHDCRSCPCGLVYIDGGLDYTRVGYNSNMIPPKTFELEIEQTPIELYDDWNTCENKYGIILTGQI